MKGLLGLLVLFYLQAVLAWGQTQDPAMAQAEQKVLDLSNQARAENQMPPLTGEPHLQQAARGHSQEMASLNFFDHESPTPGRRYPWDRVNLLGADSATIEENIYFAEGFPLSAMAQKAVDAWMHSAEHRANLLSPKVNNIGIGMAVHGNQIYVTQVFSGEVTPLEH